MLTTSKSNERQLNMTTNTSGALTTGGGNARSERLLWILTGATFLIFFQAYMVAPLLPRLAAVFHVSVEMASLMVPAYLIAYGVATLFYGLLSDRIGRRPIMIASLSAFILLTVLTGFSQSAEQLTTVRLLTGLGASGVVPLALALIGDLFPYRERGRPLGWLFGAMAGAWRSARSRV
ncbi:MFS transporter [Pollutimonas sp. H1-120]|uniref:MFS transporter n=1 Tax=Pollutimonas sp. H1-120 TaxID=3148824 RepID=UPI002AA812E7|nr:MFS transporter [Alcaligenes faecalis]